MNTKPSGGILGPAIDSYLKRQAILDALLVDANAQCADSKQQPPKSDDAAAPNDLG